MSSTVTVRSDTPPRRTETGPWAGTISAASGARHRELPARQRRCRSIDPTVTKAAFGRDRYVHFIPMPCKPHSRHPGAFTPDIRTRSPETHRPFSGLTHYKEADNRQSVCRRRSENPGNAWRCDSQMSRLHRRKVHGARHIALLDSGAEKRYIR